MCEEIRLKILKCEEKLRQAMLHSDVAALDELISRELVFTNHLGQVIGKEDDLAAHRSGVVKLNLLIPSEQRVLINDGVAVVSVRMHLSGSYAGTPHEADLRFTRVWMPVPGKGWQIVAGHSGEVIHQ